MRDIIVKEVNAKYALGKSKMKELNYVFNPYNGCLHGCLYCYAIDYSNSMISNNWGNIIYVKKNIIELLKREINKNIRGIVGISSITDPYISIEAKYELTKKAIEILYKNGFYVTIQTKSPLILRDINLLKHKNIDAGITITTLNKRISDLIEPYAPSPLSRINTLIKLKNNNIKTWLFLGPIIRNINDNIDNIEEIIKFASEYNIRIIYDKYNNYYGSSIYMKNINYLLSDNKWWNNLENNIINLCNKYNVECTDEINENEYEFNKIQKKLID